MKFLTKLFFFTFLTKLLLLYVFDKTFIFCKQVLGILLRRISYCEKLHWFLYPNIGSFIGFNLYMDSNPAVVWATSLLFAKAVACFVNLWVIDLVLWSCGLKCLSPWYHLSNCLWDCFYTLHTHLLKDLNNTYKGFGENNCF